MRSIRDLRSSLLTYSRAVYVTVTVTLIENIVIIISERIFNCSCWGYIDVSTLICWSFWISRHSKYYAGHARTYAVSLEIMQFSVVLVICIYHCHNLFEIFLWKEIFDVEMKPFVQSLDLVVSLNWRFGTVCIMCYGEIIYIYFRSCSMGHLDREGFKEFLSKVTWFFAFGDG